MTLDPPPSPEEAAWLDYLRKLWPGRAGYPINSDLDQQAEQGLKRLIDAGVVLRFEETLVSGTGQAGEFAIYRLADDSIGDVGGAQRPGES